MQYKMKWNVFLSMEKIFLCSTAMNVERVDYTSLSESYA